MAVEAKSIATVEAWLIVSTSSKNCTEPKTVTDPTGYTRSDMNNVSMSERLLKIGGHLKESKKQNMSSASPLSTHILDTARGAPATNVPVTVFKDQTGHWQKIGHGCTNADGRCPGLLSTESFTAATYKIHFDTGAYFQSIQTKGFYPYVDVVFQIEEPGQHYHVPLLLSPFGYSTYRGS